jgi:hypothetical protein
MNLIERLLTKLLPYVDIIKEVEGRKVVYLRRFFIWRGKRNIYLHHILRSDDDPDPHTHPWDFTSVILSNGYVDETWEFIPSPSEYYTEVLDENQQEVPGVRSTDPIYESCWRFGTIKHRKAEHIHRVLLLEGPCWTLVFTGPRIQSWGFVKPHQYVYWRRYLNQ